jgi:hypothetical protein
VVPSSRSAFPRHWAWGHGAGTLSGARLHCGGGAAVACSAARGLPPVRHRCQAGGNELTRTDPHPRVSNSSRGQPQAQDRQSAGPGDLRAPHRHHRAGVRQPSEQGDAPLHAAGPGQGDHAMEAVHAGAQHREDRLRQGRMKSGPEARRRPFRPPQSARTDRGGRPTRLPSAVHPFANRHWVFPQSR